MKKRRPQRFQSSKVVVKSKTHKSIQAWAIRLAVVGLIALILVWFGLTYTRLQTKVQPLSAESGTSSHAFIATNTAKVPTLLVIRQGEKPSTIDQLMVVKIDQQQRHLVTLKLPTNLSDGQTSAGQYLENKYYRELQQLVETSLALPLTGYLIEPRGVTASQSWINYLEQQSSPSWWDTTAGLPQWLPELPVAQTNLTGWQLVQTMWLVRDLGEVAKVSTVPAEAQQSVDRQVVLKEEVIDPLITSLFVDQAAKDEAVSLVIKNATSTSGLAALVARYAEHMGGEVVAVEPSDSNQTRSSMSASRSSHLSDAVSQFLGVPLTQEPTTGRERAEMELILGQDVISRLGQN